MNSHAVLKDRDAHRRELHANIGLKESAKTQLLGLLDALLADEFVLYVKTRNFHWNVAGPRFQPLHEFFEKQYEQLNGFVDEVAERSRQLGGRAMGSMKELAEAARLEESPSKGLSEEQMLSALMKDHESIVRSLRTDAEECGRLGDQGTMDFMVGLMQQHEKMAWMLRSFVS